MGGGRNRGFTLLELLLVLVIAATGYAMVVRFTGSGASGAQLKGAARTVAAGLRDARGQAIATQSSAALAVDLDKRTIEVTGAGRPRALPERLDITLDTARSETVDTRRGAIRFFPDGSSTGGRVTLAAGERKLRVDVDWLTGRVSITEGG